jgi:uncharacterized membrane protein (UPF0136 family)
MDVGRMLLGMIVGAIIAFLIDFLLGQFLISKYSLFLGALIGGMIAAYMTKGNSNESAISGFLVGLVLAFVGYYGLRFNLTGLGNAFISVPLTLLIAQIVMGTLGGLIFHILVKHGKN